jgi:hypothetical protein
MEGIFNSNLPKPRYNGFWDIGSVLAYIEIYKKNLGPNDVLTFKVLSFKLCMLLSLTSLFCVLEIAAIDFSSIVFFRANRQVCSKSIEKIPAQGCSPSVLVKMDYCAVIELPGVVFGTLCPNNKGL